MLKNTTLNVVLTALSLAFTVIICFIPPFCVPFLTLVSFIAMALDAHFGWGFNSLMVIAAIGFILLAIPMRIIVGIAHRILMKRVGQENVSQEDDAPGPTSLSTPDIDLLRFNRMFVEAYENLRWGTAQETPRLYIHGLVTLMESSYTSGAYLEDLLKAFDFLARGLKYEELRSTVWPMPRRREAMPTTPIYDKDEALDRALPYLRKINTDLKLLGLGTPDLS